MRKSRRGMKYKTLTATQRQEIWKMKQEGISHKEISQKLNGINHKTIQSVNNSEKNLEYIPLIRAVEEDIYEEILNLNNYQSLKEKQLSRIVRKRTRELVVQQSKFVHLIPKNKLGSQKRRIVEQIVTNVVNSLLEEESNPDESSQRASSTKTPSISIGVSDFQESQFRISYTFEEGYQNPDEQNSNLEASFEICSKQYRFGQYPEGSSQNEFRNQHQESELDSDSQQFYYDY